LHTAQSRRRGWLAALATLVAIWLTLPCAWATPTLPPGEEARIETLLGQGERLADCQYRSARIDRDTVRAVYLCGDPAGATEAILRHAEAQPAVGTVAGVWRIDTKYKPLQAALVQRISTHGDAVRWKQTPKSEPPLHEHSLEFAFPFLLLVLAGLTVQALASVSPWVRWTLLALVVAGAALRWWLAPDTTLGVWPYSREQYLVQSLWRSPLFQFVQAAFGQRIFALDLSHHVTLLLAVLSPLAVFAHASSLLKDPRAALFAVAVFVTYPSHIRFSHSETELVGSILLGTMSLALTHSAVGSATARARWLAGAALVPVLWLAFATREVNIVLWPLIWVTLVLAAADKPLPRRAAVALAVGGLGTVNLWQRILPLVGQVGPGGSQASSSPLSVLASMIDPAMNTLIHPGITPALVWFAVLAGAVLGLRHTPRVTGYLLAWLAAYYLIHLVAMTRGPLMNSRYHLHLISPIALLAGSAVPALLTRWPRLVVPLVVWLATTPLLHQRFIGDTVYWEQVEYNFLRQVRSHIAPGCTVIEVVDPVQADAEPRFARLSQAMVAGRPVQVWPSVVLVPAFQLGSPKVKQLAQIAPETLFVDQVTAIPPNRCQYLYLGLPCAIGAQTAGFDQCTAARNLLRAQPLLSAQLPLLSYDVIHGVTLRDPFAATIGLYQVPDTTK
jgi:hypothetical protein